MENKLEMLKAEMREIQDIRYSEQEAESSIGR
jgi:hypothetical protein